MGDVPGVGGHAEGIGARLAGTEPLVRRHFVDRFTVEHEVRRDPAVGVVEAPFAGKCPLGLLDRGEDPSDVAGLVGAVVLDDPHVHLAIVGPPAFQGG